MTPTPLSGRLQISERQAYPQATIAYTLSDAEVDRVAFHVAEVERACARDGHTTRYLPDQGTLREAQMRGFGAELALARMTGLAWPATARGHRSTRPDLGVRLEVRATRNELRPALHVRERDLDERAFALMLNRPGAGWRFEFIGWQWGWEAKLVGRFMSNDKGDSYRVEAEALRSWPLDRLAREERPEAVQ